MVDQYVQYVLYQFLHECLASVHYHNTRVALAAMASFWMMLESINERAAFMWQWESIIRTKNATVFTFTSTSTHHKMFTDAMNQKWLTRSMLRNMASKVLLNAACHFFAASHPFINKPISSLQLLKQWRRLPQTLSLIGDGHSKVFLYECKILGILLVTIWFAAVFRLDALLMTTIFAIFWILNSKITVVNCSSSLEDSFGYGFGNVKGAVRMTLSSLLFFSRVHPPSTNTVSSSWSLSSIAWNADHDRESLLCSIDYSAFQSFIIIIFIFYCWYYNSHNANLSPKINFIIASSQRWWWR